MVHFFFSFSSPSSCVKQAADYVHNNMYIPLLPSCDFSMISPWNNTNSKYILMSVSIFSKTYVGHVPYVVGFYFINFID